MIKIRIMENPCAAADLVTYILIVAIIFSLSILSFLISFVVSLLKNLGV